MRGHAQGISNSHSIDMMAHVHACMHGLIANLTLSTLHPPCVTPALEMKIHNLYITVYTYKALCCMTIMFGFLNATPPNPWLCREFG